MNRRIATLAALAGAFLAPAVAAAAGSGPGSGSGGGSLESAASQASSTGRTIAFSLIGLALAVAAVVLVFKRDFKEAIGVIAIGVIAVLLASPAGLSVLQNTVSLLFGSG
jgi:hypothetical protein